MFKKKLLANLVTSSLMLTSALAQAQESNNNPQGDLEIISVTAQKRAQSIQDVPISISAFNEDSIEKLGAKSFADLTVAIPSVSVQTGSGAFPVTYIRGIGTNDTSIGADPSIGVYIDGVYASRLGGALTEFLDIQRVEVLKGPQGTLFGRNSIGGAISIITNKPGEDLAGKVNLEYSSFNTLKTSGILNAPLIEDTLYARGYLSKTTSDGWQENTLSSENGYQQDRLNAGVKLTWYISEDVELNISSNFSDYDDTAGYLDNIASLFPTSAETQIGDDDKAVNGGYDVFGNSANDQPVNVPIFQRELEEHILNLTWQINDDMSFTSLSSYRDYTTTSSREYDGTEYFVGENVNSEEASESYGQEFRLSSESDDLFWVIGMSAAKEDAELAFSMKFLDIGLLEGTPINNGAPFQEDSLTNAETESYAIFGDANYKFTDDISITFGARYSKDEKSMAYNNGLHANGAALLGGFGLIVPTPYQFVDSNGELDLSATKQKDSWTDLSPRVVLDYKHNNTLWYGSITQGYKSGAYNSYPSPDPTLGYLVFPDARNSVEPETVTNYELGFKSDLLNSDLKLNGSFYYMDYEDLQVFQVVGTLTQLANAGEAKSSGFELDGRYFFNQSLSMLFNATWMDTEYEEYQYGDIDYSGTALLFSPEISGSISLDYQTAIQSVGELNAFLTYSYKGDHLLSSTYEQEAYSMVNANVTLMSPDESWKISLFVNNLTDEAFFTSASDNLSSYGITGAIRNAPRSYGVSLSYTY